MEFESYLKKNAQNIDLQLNKILKKFLQETKNTNKRLLPFAQKLVKSCEGGKRIRGVLVKLGFELSGGKSPEILKIGAALEILHTSLLIHDDIIDQSIKRRGKPSLYKSLGGNHYGISQALSLGDIGLYLPINLILQTNFKDKDKLKALDLLTQTIINTGWGQIMDVSKDKDKDFVNLYKTAKYTIASPLQIGAILGGAQDSQVKKLGEFGENLGIAFQIKDDILDNEVDNKKKAEKEALKYVLSSKKMINKLTQDKIFTRLLENMGDFLIERSK